ncbi:MAG: ComEC/Rec2 family competence protein [Candidatus Paceibacterota bacterium]|jgi:competence protein ComEC
MKEKVNYLPLAFLGVLFLANIFIWYSVFREERGGQLRVAFLDVGQGDSIYIEAPNGNQFLVDGGSGAQVLSALGKVMPSYDHSIDAILATHPDKDHIGGLPIVLGRFKVGKVFLNGARSETAAWEEFENKIAVSGAEKILARRGMRINLGRDVHFDILFPDVDVSRFKDTNDGSIVGKLVYKDKSFLLTGDSPIKIEQHLIALDNKNLRANVLKLGHHGSRTSSGEAYLGFAAPEYAIVSAGCKNSYGHPHKEVLTLLEKFKIPKLSTCDSGNIIFTTNGEQLSFTTSK